MVNGRDPTKNLFYPHLFLTDPPGDYSEPPGKNPSITTASPRGSVRNRQVTRKNNLKVETKEKAG